MGTGAGKAVSTKTGKKKKKKKNYTANRLSTGAGGTGEGVGPGLLFLNCVVYPSLNFDQKKKREKDRKRGQTSVKPIKDQGGGGGTPCFQDQYKGWV